MSRSGKTHISEALIEALTDDYEIMITDTKEDESCDSADNATS